MIAKQGWSIVTKPHTLVAKLYKARWSIGDGTSIKVMSEPWLREQEAAWIPAPQEQGAYDLTFAGNTFCRAGEYYQHADTTL
ncbi:hypothetical protein P8452_47404 [Trifolium repens]|nr:hypothetical protein P8452_47404 [Trifolium repens]